MRRRSTTRFIEDVSARSSGAARIAPSSPRERFVPSAHILKHLPVGLAVQRAGRLIRVNQRLLDLLGYTREVQLVGRPVLDLIFPEDWPAALAQIQRAAFRRGDGGTERLRFARCDGAPAPLLVTLTLQSEGEIPVVIATCISADGVPASEPAATPPETPVLPPACAAAPRPDGAAARPRLAAEPTGPREQPPRRGPTLLEVAEAVDDAADTEDEALATLQHLLESGRVKRRP